MAPPWGRWVMDGQLQEAFPAPISPWQSDRSPPPSPPSLPWRPARTAAVSQPAEGAGAFRPSGWGPHHSPRERYGHGDLGRRGPRSGFRPAVLGAESAAVRHAVRESAPTPSPQHSTACSAWDRAAGPHRPPLRHPEEVIGSRSGPGCPGRFGIHYDDLSSTPRRGRCWAGRTPWRSHPDVAVIQRKLWLQLGVRRCYLRDRGADRAVKALQAWLPLFCRQTVMGILLRPCAAAGGGGPLIAGSLIRIPAATLAPTGGRAAAASWWSRPLSPCTPRASAGRRTGFDLYAAVQGPLPAPQMVPSVSAAEWGAVFRPPGYANPTLGRRAQQSIQACAFASRPLQTFCRLPGPARRWVLPRSAARADAATPVSLLWPGAVSSTSAPRVLRRCAPAGAYVAVHQGRQHALPAGLALRRPSPPLEAAGHGALRKPMPAIACLPLAAPVRQELGEPMKFGSGCVPYPTTAVIRREPRIAPSRRRVVRVGICHALPLQQLGEHCLCRICPTWAQPRAGTIFLVEVGQAGRRRLCPNQAGTV